LTRKTTIICRKGVDHSDFVVRVWGECSWECDYRTLRSL
jgi:hypothetical protein